jgi:SDR family mycofactocin-dependent oxidoreductase
MPRLEDKVAFITGAARGQGRSHAVRMAQEGADIIAVDVSTQIETVPYPTATKQDLEETVRQVEALGRRIVAADADVRDLGALQEIAEEGMAQFGRLDIVVANAGIGSYAPALEMDEAMWQTMIDINLTGVWKTVRATVPHIVAGGRGGSVVLTSSLASFMAQENTAHYTATKSGLIGLMRVLAKELGPNNIRVNTLHPSTVATEMILNDTMYRLFRPDLENPTRADFEAVSYKLNRLPITMVEPDDLANAALYLVSDDGRYVTGTTHVVDAGGGLS